jgi:hypothetical protein
LLIHNDEPDQQCIPPGAYAEMFHDYVVALRAVDPTVRLSPAGFAQPNGACAAQGGLHFLDYAEAFHAYYTARWGPPPVAEWRFGGLLSDTSTGSLNVWKSWIAQAADWSNQHGAPLYVAAFGYPGETTGADISAGQTEMMNTIANDPRIVGGAWWHLDCPEAGPCSGDGAHDHHLLDPDGQLTPEGTLLMNANAAALQPLPLMSLDTPSSGSAVTQGFLIGGWTVDLGAANGAGMDTIHVWAWPVGGGPPTFLGVPSMGGLRLDVPPYLGAVYSNPAREFGYSGFGLYAPSLAPGSYYVVAYGHSVVTGTFNVERSALVTVAP